MGFSVVEFENGDGIAVVPESWLIVDVDDFTSCYWPSYRGTKLTSAVISEEKPLSTRIIYKIRVLGSYGL